jgi:hypothetical protein
MFGWKTQSKPAPVTATKLDRSLILDELRHLYALVEKLNIPVVADDYDAGYDTAVDEILDVIDGRIKYHT